MMPKSQPKKRVTPGSFKHLVKLKGNEEFCMKLRSVNLAKRVAMVRSFYKLTRVEMGAILKKDPRMVERYESGETNVSREVRFALSKLTGLVNGYFKKNICLQTYKPSSKLVADLMRLREPHIRLLRWRDYYYQESIATLAQELGFTAYYLSQMERGNLAITLNVADKLAELAQLPISVFYDRQK